jgi:hypothetical protein
MNPRLLRGIAVAVAGILATGADLPAQQLELWAAGTGAAVRARSAFALASRAQSGVGLGAEGGIAWNGATLRLGYRETTLSEVQPAVPRATRVEGHLQVGVRLGPMVELFAGPEITAHVIDDATERWIAWRLGGRFVGPVLPGRLDVFADGWVAPVGSASGSAEFQRAAGGAAGLLLRIAPRSPVAVRLSYGIDEFRLGNDGRREKVERLAFGVVLAR